MASRPRRTADTSLAARAMRAPAPSAPRRGADDAMQAAALAVSAAQGPRVFQDLVTALAAILDVDLCFIAQPLRANPRRLRMLAFHVDGQTIEDFEYDVDGTPCETILGHEFRIYRSGLPESFPRDEDFGALGLQSYAGFPLFDGAGEVLGLISVVSRQPMDDPELVESMLKIFAARVVTEIERTRSEQALRAAEASYRAIFDAAEDPIFVHDWDTGRVLDVNRKACEIYGYSRDELLATGIDQISAGVPPYTGREAAEWIAEAKRSGFVQFEWHRRSRDRSLHWDEVRLKSAVIGGERRILAFTREITGRKLAEEALRASEAQYRAIFNASADALVLRDEEFRIVDVNSTYERLTGFRREEVLGVDRIVSNPAPLNETVKGLHRHVLAGAPMQLETVLIHRDGSVRELELRGVPIEHQGRPHVLYIGRDITERKLGESARLELESQLRQAQKMDAIGRVAGGIAHDFNNILTAVVGYVVLASERPAALADPRLAAYLDQAHDGCRRARDLIAQLLTFSRGQRGDRRLLRLQSIADDWLRLVRSTLPSTVELATELDRFAPPTFADPVQVEQVMLNLCINARDAIDGRGRIDFAVRHVGQVDGICASCRQKVSGAWVELRVADDGPGIAENVLDRIFEPFFTTKDVGRGSGMGLSIVHGIVHEHGGHVLVETAAGTGTRFRVLFAPADRGTSAMDEAAASTGTGPREAMQGRVLVVDDEPAVAAFVAELLESRGLDVTALHDASEAERWFEAHRDDVDIVVTDQRMPRRTGVELARFLTTERPELPVILCTAYAEGLDTEALRRDGVVALVRKPIEPVELLSLLRAHLRAG